MPVLYSAATALYHGGIRTAALWNAKARRWVVGRQGIWDRLADKQDALRGCLWMHCASVGEFEQGRPLLEAIKAAHPGIPVLLTFFSPSGYDARRDYPLATHVEYLPPDSSRNAERLVRMIAPRAAIFVKYEFWYHHLHALKHAGVPTFLVSAIFREGQPFFTWYGAAWRGMLRCYAHIFTQNESSRALLAGAGISNVTVSGDTRFDRVMTIVEANEDLAEANAFKGVSAVPVLVCGSTWPMDDRLIHQALQRKGHSSVPLHVRCIVAPHELVEAEFEERMSGYPGPVGRWSNGHLDESVGTLFVDRMGVLARLYKYGDIAYVGGGFGDGVHSLLEAAAWGIPVVFGPNHRKFAEAEGLIRSGGGFAITDADGTRMVLERLLTDPGALARASEAARRFVAEHAGATQRTLAPILATLS